MDGNVSLQNSVEKLSTYFGSLPEELLNLQTILEMIPSAVVVVDAGGKFRYVNKRGIDLYGIDDAGSGMDARLSKVMALRLDGTIFPPEEMPANLSLKSGQAVRNVEMIIQNVNGAQYPVNVSSAPLYGKDGNIGGAIVTIEDFTGRKRAEEALRESEERQMFLLKLSDALRPLSGALEIQRAAMRVVGEYLGTDRAMYNEITDDGKTIHIEDNYVRDGFPKVTGNYPVVSFGAAMDVLRRGETLMIEDQTATPLKTPSQREASTSLQVFASATVPLIKDGRWVASFGVTHGSPRKWSEGEIAILKETAERTWAAVERARAEEALRKSDKRQEFLLKLSDALRPLSDAKSIQDEAARLIAEHLGVPQASYTECCGDRYVLRSENTDDSIPSLSGTYNPGDYSAGTALLSPGRDMVIPDMAAFTEFPEAERARWLALNIHAVLSTPLIKEGKIAATFTVRQSSPREWTPDDVELLRETAERTWGALARVTAEEALARNQERFYKSFLLSPIPTVFFKTDSGHFLQANESWLKLTGYTMKEILGHNGMELSMWVQLDQRENMLEKLHRDGSVIDEPIQIRTKTGEIRDVLWSGDSLLFSGENMTLSMQYDITRMKQAEDALRESEERYMLINSLAPFAICLMRYPQLTIEQANVAYERMFGLNCGEAIGKAPDELGISLDSEGRARMFSEVLKHGSAYAWELAYATRSGKRCFGSFGFNLIEIGGQRYMLGTGVDITERKRIEEALRESEERFRALFDSSSVGIAVGDTQGRLVQANRAFQEMVGYAAEELLCMTVADLTYPEDSADETPQIEEILAGRSRGYGMEKRYVRKDGQIIWVNLSTNIIHDRAGNMFGVGMATDITARKRAEEALRESEARTLKAVSEERQRLYDVLENLPAMVCLITPDYHVPFANQAFRRKFGEPSGRCCYEFCFGKDQPCEFCQSLIPLETGRPQHWESHPPDGSVIDVYDHPFTDVDGSPLILEMDIDITERRRAEEALQASEAQARLLADALEKKNRLVTDFFINISHEFKTPLTILMLGLELLEAKAKNMKNGYAFAGNLAAMRQNSYRLNRLVGNLLDITKLDAGFMQPKWERTDAAEALRSLALSVEPFARQKGLQLDFDCEPAEIPFTTDVFMLERIMLNLLSNAIKHTPPGGRISLSCRVNAEGLAISVADTGEGIAEAKQAIIFDRFSQVDTRMTRVSEGTGIGLALTKSLVELLGGKTSVESTLGAGSTFTVELPALEKAAVNGVVEQGGMQMDKRVQMELSDIIS